jgi:hypothetical protein
MASGGDDENLDLAAGGLGAGAGSPGGAGAPGYDPEAPSAYSPGEISVRAQEAETLGDACHDFLGSRGKIIQEHVHDFLRSIDADTSLYNSKIRISQILHEEFNGTGPMKADLHIRNQYDYPFYPDTAKGRSDLIRDLFTVDRTHVKPLIFMIPQEIGDEFKGIITELKGILIRRFNLAVRGSGRPLVGHDAFKRDGFRGNIFDGIISFSAANLCDPGTTGSKWEDILASFRDGTFILDADLVHGRSYWGEYEIHTKVVEGALRKYNGATLILTITGQPSISLDVPRVLTNFPSVADLSIIYDAIVKNKTSRTPVADDRFIETLILNLKDIHRTGNIQLPDVSRFYGSIIRQAIRLYDTRTPHLLLKFVFFLKEIGDMMLHKVAIKYKYISGATTDLLSWIAFIKRGTPMSYMLSKNSKRIPTILMNVAGSVGRAGQSPEEIRMQMLAFQEQAREKERVRLTKLAERAAAKKLRDIEEANLYKRKFGNVRRMFFDSAGSKRGSNSGNVNRGRSKSARTNGRSSPSQISNNQTRRSDLPMVLHLVRRAEEPHGGGHAGGNCGHPNCPHKKRKSLSKRKQGGGYRHKTFKQKGGALEQVQKELIINNRFSKLINGLFKNLYRVMDGDTDTMLFSINDVIDNDTFDMSLVGTYTDSPIIVVLDNIILGLPLARISYILKGNLNYLINEEFNNEGELNDTITRMINDFLELI